MCAKKVSCAPFICPTCHSVKYREALIHRRQEALATVAIEAIARDSIFHRKHIQTFMEKHKQQTRDTTLK
ncbi:unnamed protein product [Strongylus vulgaris]|uniref:Uncharacterized protein n=1 Tax=Strongylus vulgaris TaxID=40348 RepID=A0A3P7IU15_STRVU|nr:unnamed protein product [Strongylus vulgaris]